MPRRTKSGKKTKIADFEDKVDASKLPGGEREKYAIANRIGLMRGNKTTPRGASAAKQTGARPARMKSGKGADPKADVRQTHPPMKRKKSAAKK
jgi:hypothetical protein